MNLSKFIKISDNYLPRLPLNVRSIKWTNDPQILKTDKYWDQKDPSPVAIPDKNNNKIVYHIYGTKGDDRTRQWEILHAISNSPGGPWTEVSTIDAVIKGKGVAAPGVIYEDERVHMFLQTEFLSLDGTIEYLTSDDGGYSFYHQGTVIRSKKGTDQAGVYDPQPLIVQTPGKTKRYIVYTGMPKVSHGDVFLASSSAGWHGPYETKKIISHEEINHHNQHNDLDYEWGLEGGNILLLPNGKFLFVGVSFLPTGERGTRQRVFTAIASKIEGPYKTLGPLIKPKKPGENGHPGIIIEDKTIRLFYQEREVGGPWRIKERNIDMNEINRMLKKENFNV